MLLEFFVLSAGMLFSFFLKNMHFLALGQYYPDFLVIFLVYFALRRGEFSGIWIGFFAGIMEDSGIRVLSQASGDFVEVLGIHMFFYTLAGFILGRLNRLIDRDSMAPVVVVVFVTTLVVRLCVWLVNGVVAELSTDYSIALTAVYTALLSPIWFWLLGWVYRYSAEDEK